MNELSSEDSIYTSPGNYQSLLIYQKAEVIFDITYYFCANFLPRFDRTIGQMEQAARSGKQNIVEGSAISVTSKETEIKLTGVAKGSLLELLEDYKDFLRTRGYRQWENDSVEVQAMRKLCREHNDSAFYMNIVKTRPPETIANMVICMIKQNDYLLFKRLKSLEEKFLAEGGLREQMTRLRLQQRRKG